MGTEGGNITPPASPPPPPSYKLSRRRAQVMMIKMWTVLCALIAVSSSTLMAKSSKLKKMSNDQYSSNYDLNPALLWRRAAQAERRESRFENLTFLNFLIKDAHNTSSGTSIRYFLSGDGRRRSRQLPLSSSRRGWHDGPGSPSSKASLDQLNFDI